MTQNSDPKVPKILDFQKSAPKVSKFRGGVGPVLEEVQKKGAFFFKLSLSVCCMHGKKPKTVGDGKNMDFANSKAVRGHNGQTVCK